MKKFWFVPLVAAAVIAIGVIAGGVAMAQENSAGGTSAASDFASRVATILGLDSTQVQTAMDQAKREIRDESVKKHLDALVVQGKLTQAQADAYVEWYKTKPNDIPGFRGPGFGFGGHGHGGGHGMKGPGARHGFGSMPSQNPSAAPVVPAQ